MATAPQDSELAHSFGPNEIGFDFLPLELPVAQDSPLPTSPAAPVPVFDLAGSEALPDLDPRPAAPVRSAAPPRVNGSAAKVEGLRGGGIWLEGDALFCACPDCRAPMSIRVWLMIADCWRCGISIELSEEQEREVQRLLAEREQQHAAAPPPPPRPKPPAIPPAPPPVAQRFKGPPPSAQLPAPAPPPAPPAARPAAVQRPRPAPQPVTAIARDSWLKALLQTMPAWLVSLLVHLMLLTVLALMTTEKETAPGPYITLSSMVSRQVQEGGDTFHIPPEEQAKFDLPIPNEVDLLDERKREALIAASQDARELRLDDDAQQRMPDVNLLKQTVGRSDGYAAAVVARDPRLRVEMVTKEGGTTLTEAAVARGLRWLANHQNSDGSWSLAGFQKAGDCNCSGDGEFHGKSPGTALAMLPYLGAGQTHLAGKYKGTVGRGLRWLIQNQKDDGDLRAGSNGNEGMYTHGQATIVLCEAFAMTGDEELRVPAQKAVDFVVGSQYRDGGWRYSPGPPSQRGDTSVVGWQLMALQSARSANLTIPDATFGMADLYFDTVQSRGGTLYSYQAGGGPTPAMTAEALLCRIYLGWTKDRAGLNEGTLWLAENHLPDRGSPNIYYWYYGTQVLHHYGGPQWEEWNLKMRDVLVDSQETGGHVAGSWSPRGDHAGAGGRIYMTSLAICTLEVYYRHLPIFRQIELAP